MKHLNTSDFDKAFSKKDRYHIIIEFENLMKQYGNLIRENCIITSDWSVLFNRFCMFVRFIEVEHNVKPKYDKLLSKYRNVIDELNDIVQFYNKI